MICRQRFLIIVVFNQTASQLIQTHEQYNNNNDFGTKYQILIPFDILHTIISGFDSNSVKVGKLVPVSFICDGVCPTSIGGRGE